MGGRGIDRRHALSVAVLLGLVLSQPGHVLAYVAHYGLPGFMRSFGGIHAYLPVLLQLTTGGLGLALLLGLLVLGVGRLALGRALGRRAEPGLSLLHLFLVAGAVQVDVYVIQETVEAMLGGSLLDGRVVVSMLLWGVAGQLPLALLAAFAVRWLWVRLRQTVEAVRCDLASAPPPPGAVAIALPAVRLDRESPLARVVLAALWDRGPPAAPFASS